MSKTNTKTNLPFAKLHVADHYNFCDNILWVSYNKNIKPTVKHGGGATLCTTKAALLLQDLDDFP